MYEQKPDNQEQGETCALSDYNDRAVHGPGPY
jgi:hypothetical protein